MAKLLVVEDDNDFAKLIRDWLVARGYLVDCVSTGPEAMAQLKLNQYDLIVLDLNLPGLSGIDVCRTFRQHGGKTPIIMLTGNKTIDDKELGFDAGADDYLTKPFHMRELSARVKASLRREGRAMAGDVLIVGDIHLYPGEHKVTIAGTEVEFLPKEFALLEFFMRHPGQVYSADALIRRVWDSDSDAAPETVRSYITHLRKKTATSRGQPLIVTVHGVGYKLQPPG